MLIAYQLETWFRGIFCEGSYFSTVGYTGQGCPSKHILRLDFILGLDTVAADLQ